MTLYRAAKLSKLCTPTLFSSLWKRKILWTIFSLVQNLSFGDLTQVNQWKQHDDTPQRSVTGDDFTIWFFRKCRSLNKHRTAKSTMCEPVEKSNTAYWQTVTNPCTAPDSQTFVLSMNKQPLTSTFLFYCNTHAKNNQPEILLTLSSQKILPLVDGTGYISQTDFPTGSPPYRNKNCVLLYTSLSLYIYLNPHKKLSKCISSLSMKETHCT